MKLFSCLLFFSIVIISNGQNNQLPDPFETDNEKTYRENYPHLIKPDSNYIDYWCSIEILTKTKNNIEDLSLSEIADFLATFHPTCNLNAEFSEWSNELIFEVLHKHPSLTLQLLSKNNSLYRNQILNELDNPIHDLIDLKGLIAKLELIEDDRLVRARNIVIKTLKEK